jgi:hypothetical protein
MVLFDEFLVRELRAYVVRCDVELWVVGLLHKICFRVCALFRTSRCS